MTTKFNLLPLVLMVVGALVLVSAGSILVLHMFTTKTLVSQMASRAIARSLSGMELALRDHLDAALHQAEFIADAFEAGDIDFDERSKLTEFVAGSFAAAPQLSGVLVAGANGDAVRAAPRPTGGVARNWFTVEGDAQLESLLEDGKERNTPHWGQPIYRESLHATILNVRVPIRRDGDYLGFVAVGVSTDALSELALRLSEPPRSTVFVLYGDDKVVAHMFMALQPPGISRDKPLLSLDEIIDPVMGHINEGTPFRAAGFEPPEGSEALVMTSAGTRYIAITKPILGYGEQPLILGAYSEASVVGTWVRTMYRVLMIGVVLVAIGLFGSIIASRMITRTIRETSKSASAIASLEFDNISPLGHSRIQEIDDLSNSFNAMLIGLKSFGRYVPRTLMTRLIRENRVGAGTEERELTVMFTDIAGFTATCEGMTPAEVAEFINHHLTLVVDCIEREGGTIDKYIGDAVMAFWGAPDDMEDGPVRACSAAIAIQTEPARDNRERLKSGLPPVRIRIGIHTGPLIVGDIGAPNRINYTVVGDVVNAAQRLEGLGKTVDPEAETVILISRTTKNGLDESFSTVKAGRFQMKGKQKRLGVYRIGGPLESEPAAKRSRPKTGSRRRLRKTAG